MRCPRCGFDNPVNTKFCGKCGARLGVPCASCGTLNPEGFAFCGACGASLTSAAPPPVSSTEERKVVTILFADVTGSTAIAERLDPEQMRAIMARFFDAMAQVIVGFEGTVEKFIGDEVMAVFGLPTAHEDDPERAVRAALAMRERLQELNGELEASRGISLQMRIGINTGEVVANPQAAEKGEFIVTGDAVNTAARLRSAAEPGMTIVGERTYWGTGRLAEYQPLPPLTLKGKTLAVKAWELKGVRVEKARRGLGGLSAPMIGRDEEFGLLRGLLQRVLRERRPHLVTIVGTPGVGKTRLFEELVASATPSVIIRHGRCLPYGSTALWAVGEILRTDCGILHTDPLTVITQKLERRIDDLLGEGRAAGEARQIQAQLAGVLAIRRPAADTTADGSRDELFWALRRYFEHLANRTASVLTFDDLHWGDPELLDFIEYLAQWATGGPLLLLCLTRPELLEMRPGWGGGKRNYTSLSLEPLTREDTQRLLEELLRTQALPPALTSAADVAEGNPFFVEEILRMLIDTGVLQRADGQWQLTGPLNLAVPDTIQGVITARLDRLPRGEKTLLQEASIIGKEFWTGAVAHLTGQTEPALERLVQTLQARDLLVAHAASQLEGQREFAFKHMLIRDVAYALLPKSARAEKHRAFALWLEQTLKERAEDDAEILAHHWMQAAQLDREVGLAPQWAEAAPHALRYALMAGRKAARIYANDQAITHYQTARALAEELGTDPERIAAIEGLADVHAHQAQWEEASRLYQDALNYHLQKGDSVRQARVQSRIGSTFSGIFDFRQALPHIQSAMEKLKAHKDERELASVYLQMARTQNSMGNFKEAQEFAQIGVQLAEQHDLLPQIVDGHHMLAYINTLLGRPEAATYHAKGIQLAEQLNDPARASRAHQWIAYRHRIRGEYHEALEEYSRALTLAQETNNRSGMAYAHYTLGHAYFLIGDWSAAAGSWQRYLAMSAEVASWVEHTKSMLAFLHGDLAEAVDWAHKAIAHAEARREVPSNGLAVDWSAFLYLRLSRFEDALQLLGGALGRFTPMGVFWPAYLHPLAAEAALALSDIAGASAHCRQAEATLWMDLKPAQARLLKARGLVHATQGSYSDASQPLNEAVDLYRKIGQPYDLALVLETQAHVLLQRNAAEDQTRAKEVMQEVVGIYQQLGAEFELRRIQRTPAQAR